MVSTGYGVLHRVLWDGQFNSHLTVKLQSIHFSADLTPKSKGLYLILWVLYDCVVCDYVCAFFINRQIYRLIYMHTYACTQATHMYTHVCTHTHIHMHAYLRGYTYTDTTHTRAHTHTHTHTHTRTCIWTHMNNDNVCMSKGVTCL